MKNILMTAATMIFVASMATAQSFTGATENTNGQQQQTSAVNYNTFEGTSVPNNTPGLGSVGGNSTAPCVIANGFNIVGPGAGIGFSNGQLDGDCVIRNEASILREIAGMPSGPQKTAVLIHFCTNDETMRKTLIGMGLCVDGNAQTTQVAAAPVGNLGRIYTFCGKAPDGTFTVHAMPNGRAQAASACTNDFKANGSRNIGTFTQ